MKMQINEIANITGVSVRTLHYYDKIGLLKPSFVDEHNGYRFYDEYSLERMQEILFYRELDFSLKTIAEILSSPNYNKPKAFLEQKRLLILKKEHIERLIKSIEAVQQGEDIMNFNAFDNSEFEDARNIYAQEAKEKWGETNAYRECRDKTSNYSYDKWNTINSDMDSIIVEFALCFKMGTSASDLSVQSIVKRWQKFITYNYYKCTNEILAGLGIMYVSDERFKNNIDKHGDGTAEFISKAIEIYCK